jgi:glutathione synthase/RimK-type ligase-like ATP-grasp enzyme/Flp pilus assembly protein TadD
VWLERAATCEALGLYDDAKRAYFDVLARDPSHYEALTALADLLTRLGDARTARVLWAEAVARHPDRALPRARLGDAMLDADELAAASAAFRDALRLDPDLREANRGLAAALEREGDHAAAALAWRQAFPAGSLEIAPYRGAGPPVRVLLVTTATGGNIPVQHLLDDRVFEVATIVVEADPEMRAFPPHGVAFNVIGEADRSARALGIVERVVELGGTSVVNDPRRVRESGRLENARRLAALAGVVAPRVVTLSRDELCGPGGAELVQRHGFTFPLLLRSPGFHTGEHFALVQDPSDLAAVAKTLPGRELFAIAYAETRGDDGRRRKYRVMIVGGELYPLHLAISAQWKVHYFTAETANDAAYREEERAFLDDMPGVLGASAMRALREIASVLALDYGGIDFAFDRDGRVVVFEANATMRITAVDGDPASAYRKAASDRAAGALRAMLIERESAI